MAKAGKIEIQVELNGAEESINSFDKINEKASAMGEGLNTVGETFSGFGADLGDSLTEIGGSMGGVMETFGDLKGTIQEGGAGFMGLLGPIGAVAIAVYELSDALGILGMFTIDVSEGVNSYTAATESALEASTNLISAGYDVNRVDLARIRNTDILINKLKKEKEQIRSNSKSLIEEILIKKELIKTDGERYARGFLEDQLAEKKKELIVLEQKELNILKEITAEESRKESIIKRSKENSLKFKEESLNKEVALTESYRLREIEIEGSKEKQILEAYKLRVKKITALENIDLKKKSKFIQIENKALKKSLDKIEEDEIKKSRENAAKRKAIKDARANADLATERQLFLEVSKIKELEIQANLKGDEKLIELSKHRLKVQKRIFKDSKNQIKIAQLQHTAEMKAINQAAIDREIASEQERSRRAHELMATSTEFDAQRITDQTNRELALLDLRYEREFRAALGNENKITELQRQQTAERKDITDKAANDQIDKIGELTSSYGAGFAEAAVGAIFFGESFKEATAQILEGLARQSAVQALIETAKGVAALFSPIAGASAAHFKAATIFAGAAALAGVTSSHMAGGGGGGGASGGGVSPMGSQQGLSSAPIREEAEQGQQVFNINLSGAVIYDTKASAEQAFTDRITQIMNTPRRGMRRA